MANPSLQIGDSNWAIKEDNLLGYSKAGTRFVPEPITMTRASAGTRVNPEGLVETVGSLGSELVTNGDFSEIGPEEVTNGDFSEEGSEFMLNPNFVTDTNWGGSSSINTVTQQLTKTSGGLAYQTSGGITTGTPYKVVVDVASLDGATTIWLAGNSYTLSVGVQTIYAVGGTNTGFSKVGVNSGYSTGVGSVINSISVKEIGQDWTFADNWTIDQSNSKATSDGSQTGNVSLKQLNSTNNLVTGKTYKVQYTISGYVAGAINPHLRGTAIGNVSGNGPQVVYGTAGSGSDGLNLYAGSTFSGSISNVSVKEVGQDWSLGTGWSVENNQLVSVAGTAAYTTQVSVGEIGKTYQVTVDVDEVSAGTTYAYTGVGGTWYTITSPGVYTFYVVWDSATSLGIYKNSTFAGKWNSISVKEATVFDLARVDYTDGTSSLLVEPQRTNLVTNSEDFNSWYAQDYVTVTEDTSETTSPSGNNTASKITINSVSTIRRLYEVVTTSSGNDYTFTVYAKKGTTDYIRFFLNSNIFDVTFDLTNGTKTVTTGSGSIEAVGNDWYRLQATGTSSLTSEVPQIQLSNSASVSDYLYIWGAQFEEGSYATSYIPTYGTTVTRLKDQYSKTGISDLINSTSGSFFIELAALNQPPGSQLSISLSGDSSIDRILIYTGSGGGEWRAQFRKDSVNIVSVSKNTTITNQSKVAISWKSGRYVMYIDGIKATNYTTGSETEATTFDAGDLKNLQFSPNHNSTSNLFHGKVKQLQVYKEALSDDELTILTGTSGVHFYPSYAAMASVLTYKIE